MVDYSARVEILSQHLSWANVMSSVPRILSREVLYRDESTSSAGKRTMSRPEKKNVSGMVLKRNFSRPWDLEMYFCAGTCSTVQACLSLAQHRRFVGCGTNFELVTAVEAEFALTFPFRC